jgi:DNA mismatch repair protein MSH3
MLNNLIGSLSNAAEETRYFLNMLREQAAGKDDKLTMFRDDTITEKWPQIQEHRDVGHVIFHSYHGVPCKQMASHYLP